MNNVEKLREYLDLHENSLTWNKHTIFEICRNLLDACEPSDHCAGDGCREKVIKAIEECVKNIA